MWFFNRVVRLLFYQIENFGCEVRKKNFVKKKGKNFINFKMFEWIKYIKSTYEKFVPMKMMLC